MNKFLKDVNIEGVAITPSFVRNTSNTEDIKRVATSGNQLNDIALNTAIKYVQKLEGIKAENEYAELQIGLNKELKDYEVEFTKTGKNKFDNYDEYKNGLNDIYTKYKNEVINKPYMNESQTLQWDNNLEQTRVNNMFVIDGQKAQYDINKEADRTALNAESLLSDYALTGDENLLYQGLSMLDRLNSLGIDSATISKIKINKLVGTEKSKLDYEIKSVINDPNLSLEDKRQQIFNLEKNIMNDDIYKTVVQTAIDKKLISKNFEQAYESQLRKVYKDEFMGRGKLLEQYNTAIRNEEYRTQTQIENERLKIENNILKDKTDIRNSIKSGDDYKTIGILEGRKITGYDLINNEDLSKKYYGQSPQDILWQKGVDGRLTETNKYIPTTSLFEINNLKNKARVDKNNNIPRSESITSVFDNINNLDGNEKENIKREYVANGVVTQLEVDLSDGKVSPLTDSFENIINYASIGKDNSRYNKMNGLIGISSSNKLSKTTNDLDYFQRQEVSELVTGAILSNKFGTLFSGKDLTVGVINAQYNSNPYFANFVDDCVRIVKQSSKTKWKKANLNIPQDYDSLIENRYNNPILIRKPTQEKGTEPVIEEYNTNYIQF